MERSASCAAEWRELGAAGCSWGTRRGPLHGFPGRRLQALEAVPTAQSAARTRKPDSEFRALPKPQRRLRVPAGEHCLLQTRARLPHSHSGNKATCFSSTWRLCQARLRGRWFQSRLHTLTYSVAHNTLAAGGLSSHCVVCALILLLGMSPVHMCPPVSRAYSSVHVQMRFCYFGLSLEGECWRRGL